MCWEYMKIGCCCWYDLANYYVFREVLAGAQQRMRQLCQVYSGVMFTLPFPRTQILSFVLYTF